jgi:hypothetical protein
LPRRVELELYSADAQKFAPPSRRNHQCYKRGYLATFVSS